MAIFDNFGNKKVEKARRTLNDGGYTVIKNDGTIVPPVEEKKPISKKGIAIVAGVGTAAVAGIAFGIKRLLGGEVVSPETVETIADVVNDVASELEADEAVEALGSVAEDVIDTTMTL